MSNVYLKWQRNRFKPHMFYYYIVLHRHFLWINVSTLNQMETVEPEMTVKDFGIDGCYAQCAAVIRSKLQHILHNVWLEGNTFLISQLVLFFLIYILNPEPSRNKHSISPRDSAMIHTSLVTCHCGRIIESEITELHSIHISLCPALGMNGCRAALLYIFNTKQDGRTKYNSHS